MKTTGADTINWPEIRRLIDTEWVTLRVSGQCMEPLLMDQARVSFRKARVYFPGDIVIVDRPFGPPVIHRLIGIFPSHWALRYLTQADNSQTPDGSVGRSAILGKVCGGEGSPTVFKVPLLHRAKATSRFLVFIGAHIKNRTWSLLKNS